MRERKKGAKQTTAARAGGTPSIIPAHREAKRLIIPAHREAKRLALPTTLVFNSVSIDFSKLLSFITRSASSVIYAPAKPDKPMARVAPKPDYITQNPLVIPATYAPTTIPKMVVAPSKAFIMKYLRLIGATSLILM